MGILEWMYHYLFVVMQVLLVLVGLWMIAHWFSLKQKKSVMFVSSSPKKSEVISEPISSPSISKDEIKEQPKEVVNEVVPDNLHADNSIKPIMPDITHDSKQVQVDLTPSNSVSLTPSSLSPSSSIPCSSQSPNNDVRDVSPEVLAREERRRKRDERRAARAQYPPPEIAYRSPLEYLEDRCKLDVHTYYPYDRKKKCLVLDIDYTIFDHKSDFDLALEFKRPYLHEFLKICGAYYNIIIWSATAFFHIQTKMEKLQLFNHPDFQICFVLSKDHMIPHGFSIKRKTYFQDIKPLSLLWMKYPEVFTPDNTIHIDDVEENFVLNPSNGLRIEPFREALLFRQTDRELFYLAQYLTMIADLPSFSNLNHNKWKDYIINTLWSLQTVLSLPTFTIPEPPTSHLLEHHHQSLVIKQKMKERAKEHEREERMNRHMEEEKRKTQLLVDATLALGQVEKNSNTTNNMNNTTNIIKEATEDELIKLAKEAMERKHNNKPSSTPPRSPKSPSIRTPPKSPSHRSPLLSPSSSSSPSPSAPSFSLSPSLSSSSPSPSGRPRQNQNQFLSIPNIHNFPTSQPSLSLSSPSPPKDRRHIPRNDENTDNREKQESLAVKGLREVIMEKECLDLNDLQVLEIIKSSSSSSPSSSSSDSFISLSLPAINPIAHAAN